MDSGIAYTVCCLRPRKGFQRVLHVNAYGTVRWHRYRLRRVVGQAIVRYGSKVGPHRLRISAALMGMPDDFMPFSARIHPVVFPGEHVGQVQLKNRFDGGPGGGGRHLRPPNGWGQLSGTPEKEARGSKSKRSARSSHRSGFYRVLLRLNAIICSVALHRQDDAAPPVDPWDTADCSARSIGRFVCCSPHIRCASALAADWPRPADRELRTGRSGCMRETTKAG